MKPATKAHKIISDILHNSEVVEFLMIPRTKIEELNKYIAELERKEGE